LKGQNKYLDSELNLFPVILSGGSGTRLWPLSRACFPKQYLNLLNKSNNSLLQDTVLRLNGLKNLQQPIIICNEEQRFIVAEQMREIDITPNSILLEPIGRNTAPAIALASLIALEEFQDSILLVLSADHEIREPKKFQKAINDGLEYASNDRLVTFGVTPNRAETGYGYIEAFEELTTKNKCSNIKKFIEKPTTEIAEKLIKDKRYSWNSGIFLFKASTIISELEKYEPKIVDLCRKSLNSNLKDLNFQRVKQKYFNECPNIPIDIAVMEKTKLGTVLSLNVGWSDIGDWDSVWENSEKDLNGNSRIGKTLIFDTKNSYLRSDHRLIVSMGIKNLVIVETNDAILIADKDYTQSVKKVVNELEKNNYIEGKMNRQMFRPWGHYTSVAEGLTWQVKRLEIKPQESLSLQMHYHRAEHWVVVNGTAKVEINGEITLLNVNESIFVPLGAKHRLSNPGMIPLVLIEVQSGKYLGEDDIIRFDDNYGRELK
tara:strand:+ start:1656 stop:3119 length:1464 start_codon:yes stop_codon:yes gene_type:complete